MTSQFTIISSDHSIQLLRLKCMEITTKNGNFPRLPFKRGHAQFLTDSGFLFSSILDTYLISFQQHSGYLLDFFSATFWIPTWCLFSNILDTYLISFQQHSGYLLDFFSAIFWIPTWFLFTCETGELIFNKVSCKLVFFWDNLCLQNSLILGLCAKLAKNIENTFWLIIIYGNHLWSDNLLWTIPHSLLCCKVVIDKLYLRWTEGPLSKPNIFKVSV